MWKWKKDKAPPSQDTGLMPRQEPSSAREVEADTEEADTDQVDAYLAAVEEADTLASTDTTHLGPRTNPRILDYQLTTQDRLHRELIDLEDQRRRLASQQEHARELAAAQDAERWRRSAADRDTRAITEAQHDADEAAADLRAIRAWEREESPATAARLLARDRKRRAREFLVFAIVASGVSAVGIGALVHVTAPAAWALPWWAAGAVGLAVESVLTVLVTRIINAQQTLDALSKGTGYGDTLAEDTAETRSVQRAAQEERVSGYPWVVAALLLVASVVLNLVGTAVGTGILGAVGMVGALVAALCAGMAWSYARSATAAITANMEEFRGPGWEDHRAELRHRAAGAYIPSFGEAPVAAQDKEPTEAGTIPGQSHDRLAAEVARLVAGLHSHPARTDRGEDTGISDADQAFLAELDAQMTAALDPAGDPDHPGSTGGTAIADPPAQAGGFQDGGEVHRGVDAGVSGSDSRSRKRVDARPPEFAEGRARANAARAQRAQRRMAEAMAELEAEDAHVTPSAVRRRTGMDPRTIRRHWKTVTGQHPPNGGGQH